MLRNIKLALRIKSGAFNSEIKGLIAAAVEDLQLAGVHMQDAETIAAGNMPEAHDPLIERIITLYVKAHFGLDNSDTEKYQEIYNNLKQRLTLSEKYKSKEGAVE